MATHSYTARNGVTKQLLLWLVVVLQICLIGCFWLLQMYTNTSANGTALATAAAADQKSSNNITTKNQANAARARVNFVRKSTAQVYTTKSLDLLRAALHRRNTTQKVRINNFALDFYPITYTRNRTNRTEETQSVIKQWCFRDGTRNTTATPVRRRRHCECQANWHGRDCGQPEVIWRTLLAAKERIKLLDPSKQDEHQLVYMIEGDFFNLDLLELQVRIVAEAVNYFIVFFRYTKAQLKDVNVLERRLKGILAEDKYTLYHCVHSDKTNCTTVSVYKQFKEHLPLLPIDLQPTDLFLYTADHELLSQSALKFLKYYASDVRLMRFRLKHVVYGFYWQHPQKTIRIGLVSSFIHLDKTQLSDANAEPKHFRNLARAPFSNALVIGDLNYYGGWFCEFCEQVDEILLDIAVNGLRESYYNLPTRRKINTSYLPKLIAKGIYIDGDTMLLKLRDYTDNYYAPGYARKSSWQYGHLLVNLYESVHSDSMEENSDDYL